MTSLYIFLLLLGCLASYWHGRGDGKDLIKQWYESKGVCYIPHILAYALAGWLLSGSLWGLLGGLFAVHYWTRWRGSNEAQPALKYMARQHNDIRDIFEAYIEPLATCIALVLAGSIYAGAWVYTLLVIPMIALGGIVYITAKHFRIDEGETDRENRWPNEVANGFWGGFNELACLGVLVKVLEHGA